ncbi:cysteine-rich small domain-containing protein [Desulfovibrio oxyclinae]|uniref:cysteine-rich small domain-containing protein n=1 Tax=Desulfovibrio oxyclinae TaxID=63560 RepID=UPI00037A73F4|nr:cysteine-rich small domain-containing protein [Desulfovibrio oxyclinae]
MKNSYRFFRNEECEYFPCHKVKDPQKFNCLFCFCPLYFYEECGGRYSVTGSGVKDCTLCTIPHMPEGYDYILKKIRERMGR